MDKRIENIIAKWKNNNISGIYCKDKTEVVATILKMIPPGASIGFSGSVTLDQLSVIKSLEDRGNKVFNPYKSGITREESLGVRRQAAQADYYLASANAISESSELVFLSAMGNRTSGISYAKNVIIVSGVNKITPDLTAAIQRAREYATPLNIKRLNWDIKSKPMFCQTLIIEAEVELGRLSVILVDENLGF